MRETLHAEIALEALEMAVRRQRPAQGPIRHADRGVQSACGPCREALAAAGITPQAGRKGSCLDIAPMASLLHSLEVERVHNRVHATRAEARRDPFGWIEGPRNTHRPHSAPGHRSPADMERMAARPRPPNEGRIIETKLVSSVGLARTLEALHNGWDKNDPKDDRPPLSGPG
jgi:transposase InsO family protein